MLESMVRSSQKKQGIISSDGFEVPGKSGQSVLPTTRPVKDGANTPADMHRGNCSSHALMWKILFIHSFHLETISGLGTCWDIGVMPTKIPQWHVVC